MKARQRQRLGLGMFGLPACVIPYYEARKACNDNADPVGVCDAPAAAVLGKRGEMVLAKLTALTAMAA